MPENDYRRSTSSTRIRTPGHATAQYRASSGGRSADERRGTIGLIGIQTVLCAVCVAAALIIRFAGGPMYTALRAAALGATQKSITMSDVRAAYLSLQKAFPDASAVFGANPSSAASRRAGSSASSGSSKAAVSSGASKASVTASSKSSGSSASGTSKAAVSGAAKSAVSVSAAGSRSGAASFVSGKSSVLTGAGGQDLNVYDVSAAHADLLPPPAGATLAPVLLSVRPILPVEGRLTSRFGWRIHPVTGKLSFHTGIDIAAAEGTPVEAALPGVVSDTGNNDAYGNYLLIDDGGGVSTFYGHCSKVLAQKGAELRAGAVVAKVGSTGISTGPHLHFEIRVNNIYTNPLWQFSTSSFSV